MSPSYQVFRVLPKSVVVKAVMIYVGTSKFSFEIAQPDKSIFQEWLRDTDIMDFRSVSDEIKYEYFKTIIQAYFKSFPKFLLLNFH